MPRATATPRVHGNAGSSTRAQHVYAIFRTDTAGNVEVFKWGISGGKIDARGLSRRAERQVRALNRAAAGQFTYQSTIVHLISAGPGARTAALALERRLVYDHLRTTGAKPPGNIRP